MKLSKCYSYSPVRTITNMFRKKERKGNPRKISTSDDVDINGGQAEEENIFNVILDIKAEQALRRK